MGDLVCRPNIPAAEPVFKAGATRMERASFVAVNPLAARPSLAALLPLIALLALGVVRAVAAEQYGQGRYLRCEPSSETPVTPPSFDDVRDPGSMVIESDFAELEENGLKTFAGGVAAVKDDLALRGERIVYDENGSVVDVLGAAEVWNSSIFWQGEHARTLLDTEQSTLDNGTYALRGNPGHGKAIRMVDRPQAFETVVEDADYTTCPGEDPDWRLRFSRLRIDNAAERATARNLMILARGVPVFYTPYMSFPLSDKRQSGLLTPSFGSTQKNGLDISVPYYWNIAPEYDATLGPRYLGERGTMLQGEFRYLLDTGQGNMKLEWLPSDNLRNDDARVLYHLEHSQSFDFHNTSAYINYSTVSDRNYFEDFSNSLSGTSQQFLEQRVDLTSSAGRWSSLVRVQNFQSVDPSLASAGPYKRLPQIQVVGNPYQGGVGRPNLSVVADVNYFDRSDSVVGTRIDTRADVVVPFVSASGFITPKVGTRYTQYLLEGDPNFSSSPERLVPIASLDTGIFLDRNTAIFGGDYIHTLEPRLYYLFIGDDEQDDLPVFDTSLYDFTYSQLFREDRFAGADRVGDANQLTTALTSRLLSRGGGRELLRANVGQIFYLDNQDVSLPGTAIEDDSSSELVGELSLKPVSSLRVSGNITWDPNITQTRRGTFGLRYSPDDQHVFNLGYRIRRDIAQVPSRPTLEQLEASGRWPLYGGLSGVGRWVYSVADQTTIESFGGLEYDSCCWATRAVVRRYITTASNQFDTGVFLQVELKGFTGIGANTKGFLERYIPGYRSEY